MKNINGYIGSNDSGNNNSDKSVTSCSADNVGNVGGQALIEGLLMLGPQRTATAIRKPDGEIVVEKKKLTPKSILSKVPIVRVYTLRQMVTGVKAPCIPVHGH